ncbi:DNA polymerase III subunit alpha [Ichthyobacterium seriolicida]|uniref:DNA polymerase III subunit alpha n=1 Tax=Ichthyobacterium seriolicida TaxID=242600 RepID=A0A1J1EAJ0_9FLAO|nr:DNA polymerase III subunit alpha [Ichthyobacterium seriolicida]BAV94955.1 DNA polymerase III alpha subunit [Ichthyobacterium seriolicida]
MYLIFDTETTGLPKDFKAPITDTDNWPRMIQLAWQLHDEKGKLIEVKNYIVKPEGYTIPFNSTKIHGISTERAIEQGVTIDLVMSEFNLALDKSKFLVGHNVGFDINIIGAEMHRKALDTSRITSLKSIDTCGDLTANLCKIKGGRGGSFKFPNLMELYTFLFEEEFSESHNASADVEATSRCFLEMIRRDILSPEDLSTTESEIEEFKIANPTEIQLLGLNIQPYLPIENAKDENNTDIKILEKTDLELDDISFTHLHCHSKFSILQSTLSVSNLVDLAKRDNMSAIALTDYGNMFGAYSFLSESKKKGIKGILGCEMNICDNCQDKTKKDNGLSMVFLAKNKQGYHNLANLCTHSHVNGFYYVPRIDRPLVQKYKDNLIVLTGDIHSEIPFLILNVGESQAERSFVWWHEQFGDDFYAELIRHDLQENEIVNNTLLKFSQKYGVKVIASNNVHYANQEDEDAHDILLCVKNGEYQSTPKGIKRDERFGFPNNRFHFSSTQEMKILFKDIPYAIENTQEIVDKCESYTLKRDVLLPRFDIPKDFVSDDDAENITEENAYLRHLTYQGAKDRYGVINDKLKERIDFELETIKKTGYPGYFLIVQDFTSQARKMGVSVGVGRGSVAGSLVAYCIGITNIDPIKYGLLFERFLNPERVSLPDIDIDFDDEGRNKIIDWTVKKYGYNQVAQIITYGTMGAKSSIRDVGRVLQMPLDRTNYISKLIPDSISLNGIWNMNKEQLKSKSKDKYKDVIKLKELSEKENTLESKVINKARVLEGSVRNIGTHACGIIIAPDSISKYIPLTTSKDSKLLVTQFDNYVVEDAGLLKVDFLGLKTLTIIKDTLKIIDANYGKKLDIDQIDLEDQKTFDLFKRGDTIGVFQYESPGMQKYLKELKPTVFEDLIAMNALYRPGPIEYIPFFIKRKQGVTKIEYDLPEMEEHLRETYGITVYQEQVMSLSQKLAGFTKGEADVLRKAIGKKIKSLIDEIKPKFLEGCEKKGHDRKICEKIWKDWEAFASYAFNKSHSTCYAYIGYQTAYLKANYPAEFMASVLSNNMNNISSVTFFMNECKRMKIEVLIPDINESQYKFTVNENRDIRFGMGALKGVGGATIKDIVQEREKNGKFTSIFNMLKRVDIRAINKTALEGFAMSGTFDSVLKDNSRACLFHENNGVSFLQEILKWANVYKKNIESPQLSLFGDNKETQIPEPKFPNCQEWDKINLLKREKEIIGVYVSGHPLDNYKTVINNFCSHDLEHVKYIENNPQQFLNKSFSFAGIVISVKHNISKNGNYWGIFNVEDYKNSFSITLFGEDYLKYKHFFIEGQFLYLSGAFKLGWSDRLNFKLIEVCLLRDVVSKAKSLDVEMSLEKVDSHITDELHSVYSKYKGDKSFKMTVFTKVEDRDIHVPLISRLRIDINTSLLEKIDMLKQQEYLDYKIEL